MVSISCKMPLSKQVGKLTYTEASGAGPLGYGAEPLIPPLQQLLYSQYTNRGRFSARKLKWIGNGKDRPFSNGGGKRDAPLEIALREYFDAIGANAPPRFLG